MRFYSDDPQGIKGTVKSLTWAIWVLIVFLLVAILILCLPLLTTEGESRLDGAVAIPQGGAIVRVALETGVSDATIAIVHGSFGIGERRLS